MIEIWKNINISANYSISNKGRVRNNKSGKIRVLKFDGRYLSFKLQLKGKYITFQVHRLVAEAFIPNPDNLPIVNHIDGDGLNNNEWNLQWSTQKYNIYHSRNITKNGAVISFQKIKLLNRNNPEVSKSDFIRLILNNCK